MNDSADLKGVWFEPYQEQIRCGESFNGSKERWKNAGITKLLVENIARNALFTFGESRII